MTKNLTLLLIYIMLGLAIVHANEGLPVEKSAVRGFAGYEFGSGIDAIAADMEMEGYTLMDSNDRALWYYSTFLDIDCQLGYVFTNYQLVGGAMILDSATKEDFARVAEHLRKIYGSIIDIKISPELATARIAGPDAMIVQTLDFSKGTHEIEYIQE